MIIIATAQSAADPMTNSAPVEAFQFSVSGISLSAASGGSAEEAGFSVSTGPNGVIGFSMMLATIEPGSGLLTSLVGDFYAAQSCIGDLVLSVDAEGFLTQSTGDCIGTGWSEPEYTVDVLYNSEADIPSILGSALNSISTEFFILKKLKIFFSKFNKSSSLKALLKESIGILCFIFLKFFDGV
mgnify:CR=1 FL=1